MAADPLWTGTAHAGAARALLAYAAATGLDVDELMVRFGLDASALEDVDGRVRIASIERMWTELPALCSAPDLAIRMARFLGTSQSSLLGLLFLSSPTLGAGVRRIIRYERITYDRENDPLTEMHVDGDVAKLVLRVDRTLVRPPAMGSAFTTARFFGLACHATQTALPVRGAWLRLPEPADARTFDELFGVRVSFNAPSDELHLPATCLDLPHGNASNTLLAILEKHATHVLAEIPRQSTFMTSLRKSVRLLLPEGDATLEKVARQFGMAPRTLQKRLEDEGATLRQLVDEERRALALVYLEQPGTSVAQVAFALGFSEQSAFHRAFVRWTSQTPSDYRRASRARARD